MADATLLHAVVSNYLWAVGKKWVVDRRPPGFDFVVEPEAGRRIALDVSSGNPGDGKLTHLTTQLNGASGITEFVLLTPQPPAAADEQRFRAKLEGVKLPHRWVKVNDLPRVLGTESPGDLMAPETAARLQNIALTDKLAKYQKAPMGLESATRGATRGGPSPSFATGPALPVPYTALTRQMPLSMLTKLAQLPGSADEKLRFGQRIANATVVLSDLKNFSILVADSSSDVLNDNMARYYRLVRDAVFAKGGMLDKFIGDAVLAVFGYPQPSQDPQSSEGAAVSAVRFAHELIGIGHEVLARWEPEVNAAIETGTRVGMSTGELWPLNISDRDLELTLLGDTINLAARLEKNCAVDGILMDHRTHTRAEAADKEYIGLLKASEVRVAPSDAKGQAVTIRAWQVPPRARPVH